jgi:predicted amidophosphoribosyltransferase
MVLGVLADLVLPLSCAACGAPARGIAACGDCLAALAGAVPGPTRPEPAPDGLPPCVTAATYEGVARELLLALKERGERTLARPLGVALARAVAAGALAGGSPVGRSLLLVAVPTTAAAVRQRGGDHMAWLVATAARALRRAGWRVTVRQPLRALPKVDSTHLDRASRAMAARAAFVPRRKSAQGAMSGDAQRVVVVDDVITTGATVAAVSGLLSGLGLVPAWAACVAATQLRHRAASPDRSTLIPTFATNAKISGNRFWREG